ncbi:hypothetical protein ACFCV3_39145 [Kribbella sp. NPDC056345]|uniref:hypothetical protein n=1 Tax=Kribbella sp. NPDC056345 TaxID=3345789 RepID=UPI0035DF9D09
MGEGRWVLVRAGDGLKGKALQLLRQELAEQDLATQEMPGEAIAVGLAGGVAPVVVAELRDWIHRRKSPERVVLTIGADSLEVQRATVDDSTKEIEAFLVGSQGSV